MAQRSPSPDGRPGHRSDSTRPPRTRRGNDRAPYPGARTRTTTAGTRGTRATSRPEGASAPARRRATTPSPAPIPATVWTCGPEPIDTHAAWPIPIVETITTAFTAPGAHVVLIDTNTTSTTTATPGTDGTTTTGEASIDAAREAVHVLDRTTDTLTLDTRTDASVPSPRPFWADLITDSTAPPAPLPGSPSTPARASSVDGPSASESDVARRADLALVSLPAHAAQTVPLDRLALLAADRLRYGGIFAVYTHSDWNQGRLVDPTGAIVAAAQHADLLYLQHIVALHTPIREGRLHAAPTAEVSAEYDRAPHRATVRGLPVPHLRAHSDILTFAQPADPATPPPETGPATDAHGDEPGTGGSQ